MKTKARRDANEHEILDRVREFKSEFEAFVQTLDPDYLVEHVNGERFTRDVLLNVARRGLADMEKYLKQALDE